MKMNSLTATKKSTFWESDDSFFSWFAQSSREISMQIYFSFFYATFCCFVSDCVSFHSSFSLWITTIHDVLSLFLFVYILFLYVVFFLSLSNKSFFLTVSFLFSFFLFFVEISLPARSWQRHVEAWGEHLMTAFLLKKQIHKTTLPVYSLHKSE
jgi:hypothetical protein